MALIFSSFPLRWDITWYCWYTIVVIHWGCTPLTFGRTFLPVFRIEIWLALQLLYNIFQKCLGYVYATGQGKFMPSTAMHTNFRQTQPFICQLIASPENSLQRRSPCWLGTWILEPVQSMKGHIYFHIGMDVYVNHKANSEKLKNVWFIGRDLEPFPTITKLVLCEAGIYNLDSGTHSRLWERSVVMFFIFHIMF